MANSVKTNLSIEETNELLHSMQAKLLLFNNKYNSNQSIHTINLKEKDPFELAIFDLLDNIINCQLKTTEFIDLLKHLVINSENIPVSQCICSNLWFYGTQLDPIMDQTKWTILANLVKEIAASNYINSNVLKITLELNLLASADIIKDEPFHIKRILRLNTGLVYKQHKYNILREETEGYSKLNVILADTPYFPSTITSGMNTEMDISTEYSTTNHTSTSNINKIIEDFISNIFSIVGHFDLDPNRVLDIVLDNFELQLFNYTFICLLKSFRLDHIVHVLGFKFKMYHLPRSSCSSSTGETNKPNTTTVTTTAAVTTVPSGIATTEAAYSLFMEAHELVTGSDAPKSLYTLTAMLIMQGLVHIQDIIPYLRPSLDQFSSTLSNAEELLKKQIASYGVVSLSATTATTSNISRSDKSSGGAGGVHMEVIPTSVDLSKDNVNNNANVRRSSTATLSSHTLKPPPPAYPPPSGTNKNSTNVTTTTSSSSSSDMKDNKAKDEVELNVIDESAFAMFFDASISSLPIQSSNTTNIGTTNTSATTTTKGQSSSVVPTDNKTISTDENKEIKPALEQGNDYLGLIAALLSLKGWKQARYLLNLLESYGIDPLNIMRHCSEVRHNLAILLYWYIDKSHSQVMNFQFTKPMTPTNSKSSMDSEPTSRNLTISSANNIPNKVYSLKPFVGLMYRVPNTKEDQLIQLESPSALIISEVPSLLSYLGYHVREYSDLFARLCKITKNYIVNHVNMPSNTNTTTTTNDHEVLNINLNEKMTSFEYDSILNLICNVYLPALSSYQGNNPFLAGQVWSVVSMLPFQIRFTIYDRWYGGGIGKDGVGLKHLEVVLSETIALHSARGELKRLAKENTKMIGRKLSRYTQTCPLVVFNHVLNQVESFDNLIPFMVDALKFSTELARDVMAYSLVSQLRKGSTGDAKLKKGDTHFSQWFSALTKFIGTFYCRYPTTELKGLLHYVLQRLSVGDSLDLLVLKELLVIMGSSETLLEVSPTQLEGLSGGRALRAEVFGQGSTGTNAGKGLLTASICSKATLALREELLGSQTAIPLLLLIAQVRSRLLHDEGIKQLKLISHLYDTAQDVLMQFTEFLVAGAKSLESIANQMPDFSILLEEVGLAIPVAFQLVRPLLRAAIQYGVDPLKAPIWLQRWHPFGDTMSCLVSSYIRPIDLWNTISPRLYIIFWSLSLYDIKVPIARYESEVKRIKERYSDLDTKKTTQSAISLQITQSEYNKLSKQRDSEMKQMLNRISDLTDDCTKQKKHVEQIRDILINEQNNYFRTLASFHKSIEQVTNPSELVLDHYSIDTEAIDISKCILQYLIYPRILMSPIDAVYCTQFFLLLHELDNPLFSTLHCFDRTFKSISPLIFCSTETEASFVGYALLDMLQIINKWSESEKSYNILARDKLGFQQGFQITSKNTLAVETTTNLQVVATAEDKLISFGTFKFISKEWHTRLFNVIRSSLNVKDKEYIYIRSGLILLAKVSELFPTYAKEGDILLHILTQIQAKENNRPDLQIMAKSLITILKKRSNIWIDNRPPSLKPKVIEVIGTKKIESDLRELSTEKKEHDSISNNVVNKDNKESLVMNRKETNTSRDSLIHHNKSVDENIVTKDLRSTISSHTKESSTASTTTSGKVLLDNTTTIGTNKDIGFKRNEGYDGARKSRESTSTRDNVRDTSTRDNVRESTSTRDNVRESASTRDNVRESTSTRDNVRESTSSRDNVRESTSTRDNVRDTSTRDNVRESASTRDNVRESTSTRDNVRESASTRDNVRESTFTRDNVRKNTSAREHSQLSGSKRKSDETAPPAQSQTSKQRTTDNTEREKEKKEVSNNTSVKDRRSGDVPLVATADKQNITSSIISSKVVRTSQSQTRNIADSQKTTNDISSNININKRNKETIDEGTTNKRNIESTNEKSNQQDIKDRNIMKDSKVDTVVVTMNDVKEGVIKEGAADPQSQAAQLLAMKESMRGNITTHTKKPTSALEQTTTNTNSKHKSISESIASMIDNSASKTIEVKGSNSIFPASFNKDSRHYNTIQTTISNKVTNVSHHGQKQQQSNYNKQYNSEQTTSQSTSYSHPNNRNNPTNNRNNNYNEDNNNNNPRYTNSREYHGSGSYGQNRDQQSQNNKRQRHEK